jgi:hypothetical protein
LFQDGGEALDRKATLCLRIVFSPLTRVAVAISQISGRYNNQSMEIMQVSQTNRLEGGRRHYSIGRIKASTTWRAVNAPIAEADRLGAIRALIREAEEYGADAIIGLTFEVDGVKRADFDGTSLQRIAATGIAVKFAEAA